MYRGLSLSRPHRIIEPLASRCSKFRFKPLDSSSTHSRLTHIASAENISISPAVIDALITSSNGDLRRAITYLQSAARLNLAQPMVLGDGEDDVMDGVAQHSITPRDIQEIAGVVPDDVVNGFAATLGLDVGYSNDMNNASKPLTKGFDNIRAKVRELMREGYSAAQILTQVCSRSFL
jgi:replication factor C subunit 2/4